MKNIFIFFIIAFLAPSAFSQIKIMPLGESTTAAAPGYRMKFCDLAKTDGLSIDMIGPNSDGTGLSYDGDNAGFDGLTCSELINKIYLDLAGYSPDNVLLWEGTNDCGWAYQFYNNAMPGMITAKADSGKKVYFVDARSLSIATDISNDSIHPNQTGYDKMAVLFYNKVKPFLTSPFMGTPDIEESVMSVYPNPVTDYQLTINLNRIITEKISISLYNLTGIQVYSTDVRYAPAISISYLKI